VVYVMKFGEQFVKLETGFVEGKEKGNAMVEVANYYVDNLSGVELLHDKVDIEVNVVDLTGLRIYSPINKLVIDGETKLVVKGESRGVPILIPLKHLDFIWSTDNAVNIQILSTFPDVLIQDETSHSIIAMGTGIGKSSVSVRIRDTPPSRSTLPPHYFTLEATIELFVIQDFIPTDETCNSVINMAVNEKTNITTTRNPRELRFRVVQEEDLISIDPTGLITSFHLIGDAVLYVTDLKTSNIISYVVRVHQIHLIQMKPLDNKTGLATAGRHITFDVHCYGSFGVLLTSHFSRSLQFEVYQTGSLQVVQTKKTEPTQRDKPKTRCSHSKNADSGFNASLRRSTDQSGQQHLTSLLSRSHWRISQVLEQFCR